MGSLVKKLAAEGMLLGVDNFTAKEKENPQLSMQKELQQQQCLDLPLTARLLESMIVLGMKMTEFLELSARAVPASHSRSPQGSVCVIPRYLPSSGVAGVSQPYESSG